MAEVTDGTLVDGRYRIERRLGSGGMGEIFCAVDESLGRPVAIKVLSERFAKDQAVRRRFTREALAPAFAGRPDGA